MIHVLKEKRIIEASIIQAFREIGVATVYEASGRKGYINNSIKPAARGNRICGPAYTVQCAPGDNLMLHKALQRAQPGAVIVATVGDAFDYGYWGGLMATAAVARGIAGLAIDGCIRDSEEIARMGFPVFCRGTSIRGTTKSTLGLINYPINFGGMTIFPGDLIMGDEDGMVVVRALECAEVLEKSRARVTFEEEKAQQLKAGISSVELNKLEQVFEQLGLLEE
ncbi:MAG: 4-carboxy-4-hydroxy-2-oxoadipate aldolase/oxaloacetate decarboxylase [Spirochaetales bacterium]|nr:4-carboxy-4-hydroxy-2-oxoadipate aldolase/oxaloacetate decarboxylase [Spirochaetales bacterium]